MLISSVHEDMCVHVAFNNCRWCIRFMLTSLKIQVEKALFLRLRMSLLSNTSFVFHLLILKWKCAAYLLGIFYLRRKRAQNGQKIQEWPFNMSKNEAQIGTYCKKWIVFLLTDKRDDSEVLAIFAWLLSSLTTVVFSNMQIKPIWFWWYALTFIISFFWKVCESCLETQWAQSWCKWMDEDSNLGTLAVLIWEQLSLKTTATLLQNFVDCKWLTYVNIAVGTRCALLKLISWLSPLTLLWFAEHTSQVSFGLN